jgi:hypothetical protein
MAVLIALLGQCGYVLSRGGKANLRNGMRVRPRAVAEACRE